MPIALRRVAPVFAGWSRGCCGFCRPRPPGGSRHRGIERIVRTAEVAEQQRHPIVNDRIVRRKRERSHETRMRLVEATLIEKRVSLLAESIRFDGIGWDGGVRGTPIVEMRFARFAASKNISEHLLARSSRFHAGNVLGGKQPTAPRLTDARCFQSRLRPGRFPRNRPRRRTSPGRPERSPAAPVGPSVEWCRLHARDSSS